ncbi:MAG: hypothetical protein JXR96_30645 [Deltaproteobacteria bacterium]|nr:hypothetical protein [Deltaproteobacteria bacterium]
MRYCFVCMLGAALLWACSGQVSSQADAGGDDGGQVEDRSPGDGGGGDDGGQVEDRSPGDDGGGEDGGGEDGGGAGEIIPPERRIEWAGHVGIPGGIPERGTVCATIDADTYGDGVTDATAAIQEALDSCPDDQVVLLPAGTYRVTGRILIWSHKVLRGAGQDETVIRFEGPSGTRSALALAGWPNFSTGETSVAISAGANKGSTSIVVADPQYASAGSVMLIDQLNDGSFVDPEGVEGKCTYCGRSNGDRTLGQLVEVTAVDGNQIHFNIPLYWTYDPALSPQATFAAPRTLVRWSGIEDLTLTQPEVSATYLIEMQGCQYCWLRNVEVERVDWRAVWMLQSLQNEIRECYFHESINGYGRSHGYGVLVDMFSSANLVEDNILRTLDGGFLMTSGGAAGNVLGYNYMHDSRFDDPWWLTGSPSLNHAPHPMMNLWEGNIGCQITGDFIHGSSSHNTVFRSQSLGWQREETTANNNAVSFATKNTYMNVVGCVLGTAGRSMRYEVLPGQAYSNTEVVIWALGIMHGIDDPNVAATLLRHGNYDTVNDQVIWDPAIEAREMPASLYLEARPAWFGQVPFPPIGPDVAGRTNAIPAQLRFEQMGNP